MIGYAVLVSELDARDRATRTQSEWPISRLQAWRREIGYMQGGAHSSLVNPLGPTQDDKESRSTHHIPLKEPPAVDA